MPSPTQSRAKRLAVAVAAALTNALGTRATVKPLWHPSFASKQAIETPVVTVRAAQRGRTADGKVTGARDVTIEIGVVQHLPAPVTRADDPFNDDTTIDALDLIAEEIFDMFCRVDDDVYNTDDETGSAGLLANTCILEFSPRTPEQSSTLVNELLESDRLFLTVITVPYQRME